MQRDALLGRTFIELADTLVGEFDVVELLSLLADRCVELIDVDAAGIMLAGPDGSLRVMASTSHVMRLLELFQLQAQEGPCLDSYSTGAPVINQDLTEAGDTWPRFAAEALDAGFHSVHALPLRSRGRVIGALNMFHIGRGVMRDEDVEVAQSLADIATVGIIQHRAAANAQVLTRHLNDALQSRVVTEQAKGVVAESTGLEMDAAFELLRARARARGTGLSDLALQLVDGKLPVSALDDLGDPEPDAWTP